MTDALHPDAATSTQPDGLPVLSPDFVEAGEADLIDNVVPTRGYRMLPVVGLGGSAGSIAALRTFFENVPTSAGMAYVVVLHLAPEYESSLAALLQRHSALPVRAAADGERLQADHVYVIPPGKHLVAADGHLQLTEMHHERGKRVAVDLFFRSLADTHGPYATAVVLSGADGDGTIGIKRIKERGGLTIAQDPQEAEHPSMPDSAIATGMVDWILPSADMPRRIAGYLISERRLRLPPEDGPQPARVPELPADHPEALLREVLAFLRARTGHDFTYYKRATIVRRISRRMQVAGTDGLADYLDHLRTHPGEVGALLQDLLISVTNFFRDREAFESVEQHVPELFRHKTADDSVRVWCAACATGEEAYSMAMLLLEHARRLDAPPKLQVFGCDLDEQAIHVARAGFYPEAIAADVSEERLRRFFTKEPGGWRVRRELREMVLFTAHDLLKDAPFSRVDLASCRNLLIYLNPDAQARAVEIFHFALKPGGLLFLGASESVADASALFAPVHKKHRLYRQRSVHGIGLPVPTGAGEGAIQRVIRQHERLKHVAATSHGRPLPVMPAALPAFEPGVARREMPAAELHFKLLGRFGPASVVVNAEHDILYQSDNARHFLQHPEGEPTRNLLRLVLPALGIELRAALLRAGESGQPVELVPRPVELPGGAKAVGVRVTPASEMAPGAALVVFEALDGSASQGEALPPRALLAADGVVQDLERELDRTSAALNATVERYETSTEDLKASNEELQAMNEELRSAGEELETSREELQSLNEELTTVNTEFRNRVEELARANSDLHNLMSATRIATVFLDRELQVMRFTPSAAPLFSLIPSDVGRSIADLRRRIDYPELSADAEQVLQTLVPVERELREDGRWFLARVLPYRTVDERIAGVVLSFVDITGRRRAEQALRASEELLRIAVESGRMGTWRWDLRARLVRGDAEYLALWGLPPSGEPIDVDVFTSRMSPQGAAAMEALMSREVAPGEEFDGQLEMAAGPNAGRWVRWRGRAELESPWLVNGVSFDATEQRSVEQRQAFLLQLGDALRPLAEPAEIQAAATRLLGEHIGAARIDYRTAEAGEAGEAIVERFRSGRTEVIDDTLAAPHLTEAQREACRAMECGAQVTVTLVKQGRPVGALVVRDRQPRRWSPLEVALIEDTAERTWAALERTLAEAALREAETRSRLAIEAADLATWEWNLATGEVFWNERHFALFGMPPGANPRMADDFFRHVHPDDRPRIERELQDAVDRDAVFDSEFRAVLESGEVRWMAGYGRTVGQASGSRPARMSGVMFDITERKRAEEALRADDRRKDEFLAVLAHELRNPLAPIRNALQLLRSDDPGIDRAALRATLERQVGHLVRLVDDLMDVSRISRGVIELRREPLDLREVLRMAVETSRPALERRRHALALELPDEALPVEGDTVRLVQVFANLLNNAAKYTDEGGRIALAAYRDEADAVVTVHDNGIGIAPAHLPQVFGMFTQLHGDHPSSQGGLGIGLNLAQRLTQLHGGSLTAASDGPGRGSTFTVRLPLAAHAAATPSAAPPQASSGLRARRLLIVDDNLDAAETLGLLLDSLGAETKVEGDGALALDLLTRWRPAAVLLDLGMPDMDGYEVARRIRADRSLDGVVLVALTGWGQAADRQLTREAGFDHHLVKPVALDTVEALLAALPVPAVPRDAKS